jgi:hypothetical protein
MYQGLSYIVSSSAPMYSSSSGLESIAMSGSVAYSASASSFEPIYQVRSSGFSGIESKVFGYENSGFDYHESSQFNYDLFTIKAEYHFPVANFLKPGKEGGFVGHASEIRPFVEEAFLKMTGMIFPRNIKVSVLDEKQFRRLAPNRGTIGLSINRNKQGLISEVFVLNDTLARVMLTLGHEIGHVLSQTLSDSVMEEAKAYAFSFAWMKIIKEHNIGGLEDAFIVENPARNGLHDVAFSRVLKMMESQSAIGCFRQICREGF